MGPVDLTQQSFVELCCAGEDISALMCLSNSGYYKKRILTFCLKKSNWRYPDDEKKKCFYCINYNKGGGGGGGLKYSSEEI